MHPAQLGTRPRRRLQSSEEASIDQDIRTVPQPKLEDLAIDAVLHLGAALDVLDLHARHNITAINCVCRDLLRIYYAKADQAQSLEPQDKELLGLLHDTAVDLGYAVEVVDHLNGDEADDPILYAVSYLLKAAKRFADEGVAAGLAVKG